MDTTKQLINDIQNNMSVYGGSIAFERPFSFA